MTPLPTISRVLVAVELDEAAVGEGPPQDGMLRMAASFDLIVVGTHRRHSPRGDGGSDRRWRCRRRVDRCAQGGIRRSRGPLDGHPSMRAPSPPERRPDCAAHAGWQRRSRQFSGIVPVLKESVRPVLFVPPPGGTVERSSS